MKSKRTKQYSYKKWVITVCFVLTVAVISISLLKMNVTKNEILGIGLNNNTGRITDSNKYSKDKNNNTNDDQISKNKVVDNEKSQGEDVESEVCSEKVLKKDSFKELSKQEAYSLSDYGMLLPNNILKGYSFRSASLNNINTPHEVLCVGYQSGYSYIDMRVRVFRDDYQNRMVKVSEREKYDITKYPIPHASTIPDELYYTMNYPIFQWDELTEEVLLLRKVSYSEQGEDGGVKEFMDFTIQCGEFLIEYNIKGNSLDCVYDMITSSDYYEINKHMKYKNSKG
ncbi:hypothetical protein [Oceanirhabdus sp. W0125-5]|uniref:hypothetical protein n=1 Tax=Oceanirhabdus sp. W0125-5 TaxID=2999116 RepID=UPI0022F2F03A|nr:hypothetical protein [Oceanirhabdus sp. W0125-5]WBW96975.1 hypothetical protein OW730_25290 [Oceanirhabdus sp. W0125-5]